MDVTVTEFSIGIIRKAKRLLRVENYNTLFTVTFGLVSSLVQICCNTGAKSFILFGGCQVSHINP